MAEVLKNRRKDWVGLCKFWWGKGNSSELEPIVFWRSCKGLIDRREEDMGSTSTSSAALIHHFHLTSRDVDSPRKRPYYYTVKFCNSWKEGGLRYGATRRCGKVLRPVVRLSALDENSGDSPTETTSSLGSAVQDRPGMFKHSCVLVCILSDDQGLSFWYILFLNCFLNRCGRRCILWARR